MAEFKYNATMFHDLAHKKKADDQAAIQRCAERLAENILDGAYLRAREGSFTYMINSLPKMVDPATNIMAMPEWQVSIIHATLKILQGLGFKAERMTNRNQEISAITVDWSSPTKR